MVMARPGVQYHLGFPVLCRSVMGMWGSFFFIFIRGVVCIIWFGVQTVSHRIERQPPENSLPNELAIVLRSQSPERLLPLHVRVSLGGLG